MEIHGLVMTCWNRRKMLTKRQKLEMEKFNLQARRRVSCFLITQIFANHYIIKVKLTHHWHMRQVSFLVPFVSRTHAKRTECGNQL